MVFVWYRQELYVYVPACVISSLKILEQLFSNLKMGSISDSHVLVCLFSKAAQTPSYCIKRCQASGEDPGSQAGSNHCPLQTTQGPWVMGITVTGLLHLLQHVENPLDESPSEVTWLPSFSPCPPCKLDRRDRVVRGAKWSDCFDTGNESHHPYS